MSSKLVGVEEIFADQAFEHHTVFEPSDSTLDGSKFHPPQVLM